MSEGGRETLMSYRAGANGNGGGMNEPINFGLKKNGAQGDENQMSSSGLRGPLDQTLNT